MFKVIIVLCYCRSKDSSVNVIQFAKPQHNSYFWIFLNLWYRKRQLCKCANIRFLEVLMCQVYKYEYLHILWSKWWGVIWEFSPQRDPSCWGRGWWRCRRTTCCCRSSRTISNSLAFGSEKGNMHFYSLLMDFIVLQRKLFLLGGAQRMGVWGEWMVFSD